MSLLGYLTKALRSYCIKRAQRVGLITAGERGVVFMAPHPKEFEVSDGYTQRILAIDNCFKDRPRWYIKVVKGRGNITRYGPDGTSIRLPFWHIPLLLTVVGLVWHNGLIYTHSVGKIARGADTILQYVPGVFRILDLHGLIPEELKHKGSWFFWWGVIVERLGVRRSHCLIAVSEAMLVHIRSKYPGLRCLEIIIPIFRNNALTPETIVDLDKFFEPELQHLPGIIYAGGIHSWQQLPRTLSAIAVQPDNLARYLILTSVPLVLSAELSSQLDQRRDIKFGTTTPEQTAALYQFFQYGFVVREPNLVNKVACPTKLIEYLEHGLVPIMLSPDLGDFSAFGLRFLPLEKFEQGQLMMPSEFADAVAANRRVLQKINALRDEGLENLRMVVSKQILDRAEKHD